MAIGTNAVKKLFTPQHILNTTYDPSTGVIAVEQVALDTISNTTKVVTNATLGAYKLNNASPTVSNVTYLGLEDTDGVWLVKKMDTTSGVSVGYATQLNNAGVSTYATAWVSYASLTYGTYSEAF